MIDRSHFETGTHKMSCDLAKKMCAKRASANAWFVDVFPSSIPNNSNKYPRCSFLDQQFVVLKRACLVSLLIFLAIRRIGSIFRSILFETEKSFDFFEAARRGSAAVLKTKRTVFREKTNVNHSTNPVCQFFYQLVRWLNFRWLTCFCRFFCEF